MLCCVGANVGFYYLFSENKRLLKVKQKWNYNEIKLIFTEYTNLNNYIVKWRLMSSTITSTQGKYGMAVIKRNNSYFPINVK